MSLVGPNDLGAALDIFGDKEHPGYKRKRPVVFLSSSWSHGSTPKRESLTDTQESASASSARSNSNAASG